MGSFRAAFAECYGGVTIDLSNTELPEWLVDAQRTPKMPIVEVPDRPMIYVDEVIEFLEACGIDTSKLVLKEDAE